MIHSDNIPNFIEASSPKGLRLSMLKNNNEKSRQFIYFDIRPYVDRSGKTKWIAWFYSDLKDMEREVE